MRFASRFSAHLTLLWLGLMLAGCATDGGVARGHSKDATPRPAMRITRPDSNTVALQIVLREFVPAKGRGPILWLSGASHVGESNYYAALQRHLEGQALVLFEGVGAKDKKLRFDPETEVSIQHTMATALGLVFQLSAIDYDRPHFRNSDLGIAQLQQLMAGGTAGEAGRGGGGREFQELLQVMDGSSVLGTLLHVGLKFISSSPKLQAVVKIILIETLGQLGGDMSAVKGMPPEFQRLLEVIILERNKAVLEDLRKELRAPRPVRSISVFYGAGHLADLEKRFRAELGYRPRNDVWLTAISVDLRETGLTPGEMETMRGLIRWQMEALKAE